MLATLSSSEPKIAQGALAAALLQLVGGSAAAELSGDVVDVSNKVIVEVREKLGIGFEDNDPKSLRKIRAALVKEVDRILLGGRDRSKILKKLGDQGDLPLGVFEIRGSDQLRDSGDKLAFAKRCIVNCDRYFHIDTSDDAADNPKKWSLFSKFISGYGERPDFFSLVHTQREGKTLHALRIWRICPDFVEVSSLDPLDLLRSFVETYGIRLTFNGRIADEKFVEDRHVPMHPSYGFAFGVSEETETTNVVTNTLLKQSMGIVHLRYAYAIDMQRYLDDVSVLLDK